jgi:hypothetical protein
MSLPTSVTTPTKPQTGWPDWANVHICLLFEILLENHFGSSSFWSYFFRRICFVLNCTKYGLGHVLEYFHKKCLVTLASNDATAGFALISLMCTFSVTATPLLSIATKLPNLAKKVQKPKNKNQ